MTNQARVRGGVGAITVPDTNARVQDNLYLATNSDYLSKLEIPSDRSRIGSFDKISVDVEKWLMADFKAFADGEKEVPAVPNLTKAVEFYKLARDFDKRNADGSAPIQADLARLTGLKDFADLNSQAADLFLHDFALPVTFYVSADMKDTKVNALHFGGPSLFLPDTTTYADDSAKELLDVLKKQSVNLLVKAGLSEAAATEHAERALSFDARLAKVVKSSLEWADYPSSYNPVATEDFIAKFKSFDAAGFLGKLFDKLPDKVIVTEPRYLDHAEELFNADTFEEVRSWSLVKFINSVATYLSQDFREAAFPFSQALSGQPELQSGEKQAYNLANGRFSEVVGVYYGQTYFGADAKADVLDMIHKMLDVYKQRIQASDWLSEDTKKKAIVKVNALVLKVGYPDKIEEIYDRYTVTPAEAGGSLYSNASQNGFIENKYNLEQLFKPVDRTVWLMPGNLVNACYDPQRNDITFPAAILQKPFYDLSQSRAANYGGIGAVIAHEVSHAFDNNGAQFDEFGTLKNWWTEQDFAEFKKRTQDEIDLFDGLEYGPVTLNGAQIVSENIADQGGLTAAVTACKNEGNDLHEFYENWARVWANKQLDASIKSQVAVDVHAPGPLRANVQAQCQDEFYETFGVTEQDGMWLAPEKRVRIW